jgi:hypothetical protein
VAEPGPVDLLSCLWESWTPAAPRELSQVPLPEAGPHRASTLPGMPAHPRADPPFLAAGPVHRELRGRGLPRCSGSRPQPKVCGSRAPTPGHVRALPQTIGANVHHSRYSRKGVVSDTGQRAAARSCLGALGGRRRRAPSGGTEPIRPGPPDQRHLFLSPFGPAFLPSIPSKASFT